MSSVQGGLELLESLKDNNNRNTVEDSWTDCVQVSTHVQQRQRTLTGLKALGLSGITHVPLVSCCCSHDKLLEQGESRAMSVWSFFFKLGSWFDLSMIWSGQIKFYSSGVVFQQAQHTTSTKHHTRVLRIRLKTVFLINTTFMFFSGIRHTDLLSMSALEQMCFILGNSHCVSLLCL